MILKDGATIAGLHPVMRKALREAEAIWRDLGHDEGVTVTSGLDGVHSAGSWHYYGLAVDFRTRYFDDSGAEAAARLRAEIGDDFDIVHHSSHIHVEVNNRLAKRLGVFF